MCELESVIVQAPKLRLFGLSKHIDDSLLPRNIAILDAYNTLEILELNYTSITDQQFQDIFSKHSNISELYLSCCYELKNIEIVSENLKKLTLSKLENLKQVKIQAPNLLEFEFKGDKIPFDLPHFVEKFNYSKGLILAIYCKKSKAIFIYEDPKEIVIPPIEDEVRILIRPILHLESFMDDLMDMYPKTMSILPTTNSKVLQVLSTVIGCSDNTKTKCFYSWQRQLKEVSTYTIEKEMNIVWYWWLKSPSLFDQATTFMFKWEDKSIIHSKLWRSSIRVVC